MQNLYFVYQTVEIVHIEILILDTVSVINGPTIKIADATIKLVETTVELYRSDNNFQKHLIFVELI